MFFQETLGETFKKRTFLYTDLAATGKGLTRDYPSYKEEDMSYYDYYINREQYRERIRQAEKERIIRQIQKSNQDQECKNSKKRSSERGSWIGRISWAIKNANQASAH